MAFSFGSFGDIIKLVELSFQVYGAFYDARSNASRQFRDLADEFEAFYLSLKNFRKLLSNYNQPLYFSYEKLEGTVKDCDAFLAQYAALQNLDGRRPSLAEKMTRGAKKISFVTLEKERIRGLREAVAGHIRALTLYSEFLNLQINYELAEGIDALRKGLLPPRDRGGNSISSESTYVGGTEQFSRFLADKHDSDSLALKDEIDRTLQLAQDDKIPSEVPNTSTSTVEDLNDSIAQQRPPPTGPTRSFTWQTLENFSLNAAPNAPNFHHSLKQSSLGDIATISSSRSASKPSSSSRSSVSSGRRTNQGDTPSNSRRLPDRGLLRELKRGRSDHALARYFPLTSENGWVDVCRDVSVICKGWTKAWICSIKQQRGPSGLVLVAESSRGPLLFHVFLNSNPVPRPGHGTAEGDRKLIITFEGNEQHLFSIDEKLRAEHDPIYMFESAEDHLSFQQRIYDRKLLCSWDIIYVESDKGQECRTETLRLWEYYFGDRVLVFYANFREKRQYIEMLRSSFQDFKVKDQGGKRRLLKLYLSQPASSRHNSVLTPRTSSTTSTRSTSTRTSSSDPEPKKWIEIKFVNSEDLQLFLRLWNPG